MTEEPREKRPTAALLIAIFCAAFLLIGSVASFMEKHSNVLVWSKPNSDTKGKPAGTFGTPVLLNQDISIQGYMRVIVSLVGMAGSLVVILSKKYRGPEKHWAYGVMGTVIGYWLRGS